jgi:transcriptional regulator with XRE-family HTH domain
MATLGTKLLNLRQERKLSHTEIAEHLGVSQNAYNKWEADKCKPGTDNLWKISVFYHIDISVLFDYNDEISLFIDKIHGENNIVADPFPTTNIQPLKELMNKILQNQERLFLLFEKLFEIMMEEIKKK